MAQEIVWLPKDHQAGEAPARITLMDGRTYLIGREESADIVLPDAKVSRRHATISVADGIVHLTDEDSTNGTLLHGRQIERSAWSPGDQISIGDYVLTLIGSSHDTAAQTVLADTDAGHTVVAAGGATGFDDRKFPPPSFDQSVVRIEELRSSGLIAAEPDYLALGGGIGSFVWVDHLRIFGVPASAIRSIGVDPKPYGKYQRLCANSQIPDHERLRSNSVSTPDNIWGFPGYASREAWRELKNGKFGGLKYVFQVFGEPALNPSYTPRAGDVFQSFDVEARRIGWDRIWTAGRVLMVRKTDDERFVVAYRVPADRAGSSARRNLFMVARYLHLAAGYPASRFLPDMQDFKRQHPQSNKVVNAYEEHDSLYEDLLRTGGTVVVRGRGIVASRILQRLGEVRAKNASVRVLHLMRSRITTGRRYDLATRQAANDIEFQPFNWPKSCWGGTLRDLLEQTPADERYKLLAQWGGTTTADRPDWDDLIVDGKREGWYRSFFGSVKTMALRGDKIVTEIQAGDQFQEEVALEADYMIDCTGLIADITASPLMADLIETYDLRRNRAQGRGPEAGVAGLFVSNQFEVEGLRNGRGRVFSSGVLTVNGPYAAVDSFLGLQYAALRSVDKLQADGAPGISSFGPMVSLGQWLKWTAGTAP